MRRHVLPAAGASLHLYRQNTASLGPTRRGDRGGDRSGVADRYGGSCAVAMAGQGASVTRDTKFNPQFRLAIRP